MKTIVAIVFAVVLTPGLVLAQALSEKVPADALIYVGWKGSESLGAGYDQSHLKAIADASQFSQLINDSLPKLIATVAHNDRDAAAIMKSVLAIGGPLWRHPTAFYFGGVDFAPQQEPSPRLALICDAGDDGPQLSREFAKVIEQGGPDVQQHVHVKTMDRLVILSTYDYAAPDQSLSQVKDFQAELAKVTKDPVTAVYVDVTGILKVVDQAVGQAGDPQAKENWPHMREVSGIDGLKKIVAANGFDGKNWVQELFVDAPAPRTGLLAMLDSKPLSDDILKLIPSSATMAAAGQLDLAALFNAVRDGVTKASPDAAGKFDQAVDQANQNLGFDIQKDLLAAFGPEWATYVDPVSSGDGALGFVIVNRARNGDALDASLGKLEEIANSLHKQNLRHEKVTLQLKQSTINGVHVHYLASPLITPAWAVKDGVWYFALYPQILVSAVARAGDAKSILDNPAFVDVRKRLNGPEKVSSIAFSDLPKLAPGAYQTILLISRLYLGGGDLMGLDSPPLVLPTLDKITPELEPSGQISWSDDTGFYLKGIEPFPGSEVLGAGSSMGAASVGEGALMVSILLPSLNRARETANRVKCASNERQVCQAILLYANDNKGAYPPDLGALIKTEDITAQVFVCPSGDTKVPPGLNPDETAQWVNDHSDYIYLGAGMKVDNVGPSTVVLYEKDEHHGHDGMNIAFGDGHVEFVPMAQAQKMIEDSKTPQEKPQ